MPSKIERDRRGKVVARRAHPRLKVRRRPAPTVDEDDDGAFGSTVGVDAAREDAAEARNADANTVLHVGRLLLGGEGGDDPLRAFYRFRRGEGGSVEVELDGARREFMDGLEVCAALAAEYCDAARQSAGGGGAGEEGGLASALAAELARLAY